MIQRGESFSLRHDNKKIRLVDEAFRRQVRELEEALVLPLVLAEIASGRVIIETKDTDGKITAVTSKALQNHEKAKKYEKLEVKDESFFEELAKLVKETLETETTNFKAEEKKAAQDLQKRAPGDSRAPLPSILHHVVLAAKDEEQFIQAPGIKKITQRMVEDALEQARRSQEHKVQEQKQQKRKREKQIDKDHRLFERNQEFRKSNLVK